MDTILTTMNTAQNTTYGRINEGPVSPVGDILRQARLRQKLSLRALAKRANTSHATLSAYEGNHKVPSTTTFLRILEACDYGVDVVLHPRIRSRRGMSRGEELIEVLTLAEQFPAKHAKRLAFPVFKRAE